MSTATRYTDIRSRRNGSCAERVAMETATPTLTAQEMLNERVQWVASAINTLGICVRGTGHTETSQRLAAMIADDLRALANTVEARYAKAD